MHRPWPQGKHYFCPSWDCKLCCRTTGFLWARGFLQTSITREALPPRESLLCSFVRRCRIAWELRWPSTSSGCLLSWGFCASPLCLHPLYSQQWPKRPRRAAPGIIFLTGMLRSNAPVFCLLAVAHLEWYFGRFLPRTFFLISWMVLGTVIASSFLSRNYL